MTSRLRRGGASLPQPFETAVIRSSPKQHHRRAIASSANLLIRNQRIRQIRCQACKMHVGTQGTVPSIRPFNSSTCILQAWHRFLGSASRWVPGVTRTSTHSTGARTSPAESTPIETKKWARSFDRATVIRRRLQALGLIVDLSSSSVDNRDYYRSPGRQPTTT